MSSATFKRQPASADTVSEVRTQCRHLRVMVISDAELNRNGVGTYYSDLSTYLANDLESLALIAPGSELAQTCHSFSIRLPGDPTQRMFFPRVSGLTKLIEEQRPHVVIVPSAGPYSYFGIRAARRVGATICIAHHTDFAKLVDQYWKGTKAFLYRKILTSFSSWLLRQADQTVALNVDALRDARQRGARRVSLVGTPLAPEFIQREPPETPEDIHRVVYVGRLAKEKSVERILEAAEERTDLEFAVIGDGPLRRLVERAAKRLDNLTFYGWMERGQVLDIIDQADALVLPSTTEAFGTAALEGMARRRLVLVSNQCGIAYWQNLAEGLFAIEAGESVSDALTRLQKMPRQQRRAIAERGRQAVVSFNEETLMNWRVNLLEMLRQTTGGCPVPVSSEAEDAQHETV